LFTAAQRPPPKVPAAPHLRLREDRLESLMALAGQLAHDFNNFIAPLLGYASLIKEDVPPDSRAMKYAVAMDKSARRSERILETILLAARPQRRFRPKSIDFKALLQGELDQWSANLPASAQITLVTDLEPCQLTVDPDQWQMVIQQMLNNARFALATGGCLEVSLHRREITVDRADELGLNDSQVVELVFRDNGLGMPANVRDRAFDPFFTTRPKNQGLGLGLALAHSITRFHEGQIDLESAENEGTKITIWLPINQAPHLAASPNPVPKPGAAGVSAPSAGRKILLAEDDLLILEVIRTCLMRAGYEVLAAREGQEAIDLFTRHAEDLGLILADVAMPNLSGIELVRRIRQIKPQARIVLMSGEPEAVREEKLAALEPPRPPLLKKPFAVKDLMAIIRGQTGGSL
jgi:hypothetical protein